MIARNEERFLAGCLESARGVADEVIVVDTGSTDATREIARAAGARVIEVAWRDDFAAARNVGLDAARGTHVLVLDADERLAAGAESALRAATLDPELLLGVLPLHNASHLAAADADVLRGAARIGGPVWVPRFFPRRPELRFTRRIHETLTAGFNVLHRSGGGVAKAVQAPLIHLGEMPSVRAPLGRDERNERLLRAALDDDPADGELAGYLAAQLLKAGRLAEARAAGERSLDLFLRALDTRPAGHPAVSTVRLGYALSFAQSDTGAPEPALRTARECAARFVCDHANLVFAEAYALEKLGRTDEAAARYGRCLELHGIDSSQQVLTGVTSDLARWRLAELAFARGDHAEALAHLRDVGGAWVLKGALLGAEIELGRARPAGAMEWLGRVAHLPQRPPDYHALAHRALSQLGRDAGDALLLAHEAPDERWIEQRRRACLRCGPDERLQPTPAIRPEPR